MPNDQDLPRDIKSQSKSRSQHVQRRSSKHGSSKDRHGRVFDDSKESTIRAVTPEPSSPSPPGNHSASAAGPLPPSPMRISRKPQSHKSREHSPSQSNTDEDSTIDGRRWRAQARSKARDDLPLDASPGSFISKTRKRLGSITTNAALSSSQDEHYAHTIGFPSVIQSPATTETFDDRRAPRTPRRTFSPDSMSTFGSGGFRSPILLDTDSAKILQLMKTTCGRMHGILFFRPMHTTSWASGYCAINVAPGSLVCQVKGEVTQSKILISDLRGCSVRTHYDPESQSTYLSVVVASSGSGFQLRPPVPETFDSWLAALLCWQPLRPRGVHNKMTKPQPVTMTDRRPVGQRRVSDTGSSKNTAIIKIGKMLFWDGPLPSGSQMLMAKRSSSSKSPSNDHHLWRKVSCTLHENGDFKLLGEVDAKPILVMSLSQLARCAVQRLDASVLDMPFSVAIYPHYTAQGGSATHSRPTIVCLESRIAFEAWYVLLRALTVPELYGPEQRPDSGRSPKSPEDRLTASGMFRIERSLVVKVTEAKFLKDLSTRETYEQRKARNRSAKHERNHADVYAEISCGKDLRARTAIRPCGSSVFWADEFVLKDFSSVLTGITVALKMGNPGEKEWTMIAHGPYDLSGDGSALSSIGGIEISTHDPVLGKVEVQLDELEQHGVMEKWWPTLDNNDQVVGHLLMRVALQETVVLMHDEYKQLSAILHNFSNSITTQIAQVLGPELKHLSDVLLDVFQASGAVTEWINNLVEEEIDGIYKDTPPMRMRFSGRIHSNDSYESAEQRELLVRDLSRSATMEANLLFRGNSLVTKALDAHMRRLGKEYLEEVLGDKLRKIVEKHPDCEVDPVRVRSTEQLDKNWANLIFLTNTLWRAIAASATRCPPGLRIIFKHVQSCAEDRYGSFIRTVKYTSVSGFLFLRFFCPAILNPKLFGLLQDHPPDHTKRTFTLIAKSLNVLANMAKFGTKEPWMEPMNKFLSSATTEFKDFIEEICNISSSQVSSSNVEPQFAAPNQIKGRLPLASREGLPSLPFLLDSTKLLAELVDLWAANAPASIAEAGVEEALQQFHPLCLKLHAQSKDCLSHAEQAERPDGRLESKWQQLLSEQQRTQKTRNLFEDQFGNSPGNSDLTALPQTADSRKEGETGTNTGHVVEVIGEGDTTPSSSASGAWDKRIPFPHRSAENRALTNSTNSSTASFEVMEDMPRSRDGPSKNRILDLMTARRKHKAGDRAQGDDDGYDF